MPGDQSTVSSRELALEQGFSACRCQHQCSRGAQTALRERAGVLALSPDARAILVVTSRHQAWESGTKPERIGALPRYILPAGGIEAGETAAEAACREAYEEAGARVHLIRALVRHCSRCQPLLSNETNETKGEIRRPAVTYWFLAQVQELLPAERGQWPEAGLRQRCYLPLTDTDADCCITRHSPEKLTALRTTLGWRADTRAAIEAFLKLPERDRLLSSPF
jgi:8-oxo-dGTP pyrophosphatase MutT (NUDIX family)